MQVLIGMGLSSRPIHPESIRKLPHNVSQKIPNGQPSIDHREFEIYLAFYQDILGPRES